MKHSVKDPIVPSKTHSGRLYAFIVSADMTRDRDALLFVAHQFSARIETLDDGVLFDVGGLERLIGKPDQIAQNILEHLKTNNISGNVAVASTVDTAILLARQKKGVNHTIASPDEFQKLPLRDLGIANDSIGIFNELGIHNIEELPPDTGRRPDQPLRAGFSKGARCHRAKRPRLFDAEYKGKQCRVEVRTRLRRR